MREAPHDLVLAPRPPSGTPALRVVIADDEDDIRNLVALAVRRAGGTVVGTAADGAAALAAVQAHSPDLAVLDVSMPRLTGLDVCAALRADPAIAGVRVLLLSAGASQDEIASGLAAGADSYLAKPFPVAELVTRLRALAIGQPA